MNYIDTVRYKPWLKIINTSNITVRLQKSTRGNAFVVYNLIQNTYELHTVEAYNLSGDSYNCSLDRELLSQFLIWDYNATDFSKNLDDILSEKALIENSRAKKDNLLTKALSETFKTIERTLGTQV